MVKNIPIIDDWLDSKFLKMNNFLNWNDTFKSLHFSGEARDINSNSYRRLVFDEICANFITLSKNRARVKSNKLEKLFNGLLSKKVENFLPFKLTGGQINALKEINEDLRSNKRMFRILQGDVGSGKTIISLLSIANVIESGYQCA